MSTLKTPPDYVPGHGLLKGKYAVVTAAAGAGIGFSTAMKIAEEGAAGLLISDIHEGRLEKARAAIEESTGVPVYAQPCDVSSVDAIAGLLAAAQDRLPRLDVLVNNAGFGAAQPLLSMTDEDWDRVHDITLKSTFRITREMLRIMREQGQGVIVNNASVLGWRAQAEQSHYAAAKAGVMAFTRCAALEAVEYGVRINAVSPSFAVHDFLRRSAPADFLAELESREAYGRGAECWEVANVIVFLASDYSSYMTGEVVSVSSQHA
jgi:3-oxoacyl-[acyl-carrier protein] reductase